MRGSLSAVWTVRGARNRSCGQRPVFISFPLCSMERSTSKPAQVFRARGVSASVFKKQSGKDTPFFKVAIQRTYKDGDDFKTTSSFGRDELPLVAHVANQAWEFVLEQEAASRSDTA